MPREKKQKVEISVFLTSWKVRKKLSEADFDEEFESAIGLAKFEAEEVEVKNRMWCYQMLCLYVL